jgi:hypothetical protein
VWQVVEAAQAWGALFLGDCLMVRCVGWKLNLEIKGHRVSDFPHAIYRGGNLGDFDAVPNPGLWILEIQIAHPSKPYGAFYEDLLA